MLEDGIEPSLKDFQSLVLPLNYSSGIWDHLGIIGVDEQRAKTNWSQPESNRHLLIANQ